MMTYVPNQDHQVVWIFSSLYVSIYVCPSWLRQVSETRRQVWNVLQIANLVLVYAEEGILW